MAEVWQLFGDTDSCGCVGGVAGGGGDGVGDNCGSDNVYNNGGGNNGSDVRLIDNIHLGYY